ncbi:hypothetical protein EVAR_57821_1 [Eumeta japonica]|uniref:Uncharacterized protein n=1 Tax=Eumeta variegata TaxID=151549 RepID=A0A4C1ZXP9_EUMVA|nr:hypothetical protein EVAR_57821_1 [Eumeta japonica]
MVADADETRKAIVCYRSTTAGATWTDALKTSGSRFCVIFPCRFASVRRRQCVDNVRDVTDSRRNGVYLKSLFVKPMVRIDSRAYDSKAALLTTNPSPFCCIVTTMITDIRTEARNRVYVFPKICDHECERHGIFSVNTDILCYRILFDIALLWNSLQGTGIDIERNNTEKPRGCDPRRGRRTHALGALFIPLSDAVSAPLPLPH